MFPVPNIEKFSLVAPLGLCFHDAATGERIFDGLAVSIYSALGTARIKRTEAFPNRSGVYVLHSAEGLGEFSRGAGDAEFWRNNPPQKPFIAEVIDLEQRFQPFRLTLELPVKGIYRWENPPVVSPNKNLSSIPLYSAPTRRSLGGMSVIRAELRESDQQPAAFAVLEARFDGNLIARGIADRDGRIVLMFPALLPPGNPLTSPPNATREVLADQNWNLDLTLKYEPRIFQTSPPLSTESEEAALPDLRLALAQQSGTLWSDAEKNDIFSTAVLRFGRESILRSRAAPILSPNPAETVFSSYLFVSPA